MRSVRFKTLSLLQQKPWINSLFNDVEINDVNYHRTVTYFTFLILCNWNTAWLHSPCKFTYRLFSPLSLSLPLSHLRFVRPYVPLRFFPLSFSSSPALRIRFIAMTTAPTVRKDGSCRGNLMRLALRCALSHFPRLDFYPNPAATPAQEPISRLLKVIAHKLTQMKAQIVGASGAMRSN